MADAGQAESLLRVRRTLGRRPLSEGIHSLDSHRGVLLLDVPEDYFIASNPIRCFAAHFGLPETSTVTARTRNPAGSVLSAVERRRR